MAKKETEKKPKDIVEPTPEELAKLEEETAKKMIEDAEKKEALALGEKAAAEISQKQMSFAEMRAERDKRAEQDRLAAWVPKTQIGKDVKSGKEKNIDHILDDGKKILESEVVDLLLNLQTDLLSIGQAKGKFGGGKRRAWRQTQRKTKEGNILTFSAMAVVGDRNGHVGVGYGKSKETLPSREKAIRSAKLGIVRIGRGCAHFDCSCDEKHTVPYTVEGKSGSVSVKLMPAPQGTGLVVGDEAKKILRLAGIKDVYGVTKGHVRTTFNLSKAVLNALKKTREMEQ